MSGTWLNMSLADDLVATLACEPADAVVAVPSMRVAGQITPFWCGTGGHAADQVSTHRRGVRVVLDDLRHSA
jgi:hypothetical protein